jgi:hypothetical protein
MVEFALQVANYALWFPLAVLVITAIIRAGVRKYALILAYMVVTFLAAFVEAPSALSYTLTRHAQSEWYKTLHSVAQAISYPLVLAIVVSLVYQASRSAASRHLIRTVLGIGAPLYAAISFLVHFDRQAYSVGMWLTPWTRDLNFCAAILDIILWALLLARREKDRRLLLLVAGLGIDFAGNAVAEAVRSMAIYSRSHPIWVSAAILTLVANCGSLFVWWQAFRVEAAPQPAPEYSRSVLKG